MILISMDLNRVSVVQGEEWQDRQANEENAMIEVLPAPDHVRALRMSGTLTADDYDRGVSEIEAKPHRQTRIGVFVDMTGFEDMTAEAAAKDVRYGLGKIGEWKRFPEAVVTDKQWMRTLIKLMDPVLPQVEARTAVRAR